MFEKKVLASRYLLVKQLGQGGFGKTYLAKDLMLPGYPQCVVKKLHPVFNDSQRLDIARRLFETEAQALQKLGDRERIPQLLAYFEENQQLYLVMQYVEGNSLIDELIPGQPWPEVKVIKLLKNCLNILDYIHSQGVIHRDIKPANLICRQKDNKLILVDFGAVKEVMLTQSPTLLSPTVAVGTTGYMPEEQARGKPVFNSDIYALGIISIQALTGCDPLELERDRTGELIWQPQTKVSPKLAKIIAKMTRQDSKQRYVSAKKVIEAIHLLIDSELVFAPNNSIARENSSSNNSRANSAQSNCDRLPQIVEESSSKTDKNDSSLEPEQIDFAQQQLANYVGPLSKFIVRDTLTGNPQITLEELIEKLAAEIPDSNQAKQFTKILVKLY